MCSERIINDHCEGFLFAFKRSILPHQSFAAVLSPKSRDRKLAATKTYPRNSCTYISIIHHRPSSTLHLCSIASSLLTNPECQISTSAALRRPCGKMANEASIALTNRALRTIKTVRSPAVALIPLTPNNGKMLTKSRNSNSSQTLLFFRHSSFLPSCRSSRPKHNSMPLSTHQSQAPHYHFRI